VRLVHARNEENDVMMDVERQQERQIILGTTGIKCWLVDENLGWEDDDNHLSHWRFDEVMWTVESRHVIVSSAEVCKGMFSQEISTMMRRLVRACSIKNTKRRKSKDHWLIGVQCASEREMEDGD
jgi:hypothetical protein